MTPQLPPIDFDSYPKLNYWTEIRTPLFEIMTTIVNKVDRELRAELQTRGMALPTWMVAHLRITGKTYETIEALAFDRKQLALGLEISVAIPPLARVIIESLFSLVFVMESPTERLAWFWKHAWHSIYSQHQEWAASYAGDQSWQPWLSWLAQERDLWRDLLTQYGAALTPAELADPDREIEYWPTPGRMRRACTDQTRKDVIAYFQARCYGMLSAASHLSGTGLMAQAGVFAEEQQDDAQRKYFSDQLMTALVLMFSLASQYTVDVIKERSLAARVIKLWQSPNLGAGAKEAYDRCFRARLEALAAG